MKLYLLPLLGIVTLGVIGCDEDDYYPPAGVVEVDSGTPYVYDNYYYDDGYYHGPYWYWHDHDGRAFRERREFHERHLYDRDHARHEYYEHGGFHGEHHER